MSSENLFIEQAEYIQPADFLNWSSDHPKEDIILKKLTQAGAKLLTGPRGCGKTTLLLKAFNKLHNRKVSKAFPVYVNFKSSLKLEPFYRSQTNGGFWFSQWMYLKLYEGMYESLGDNVPEEHFFTVALKDTKKSISWLELGEIEKFKSLRLELSTYDLDSDINKAIDLQEKTRCVLLLDDAAHAFSPEQQRDFFEFFRKIKSRRVSPKAAIYPGVTSFAPTFNIGHDAEEVNAWVNPEDEEYLDFMFTMLKKRLPEDVFKEIEKEESLLNTLCFASFGIPRTLLNMVRNVYEQQGGDSPQSFKINFSRKNVLSQVKASNKSVTAVYEALEQKLPTYKSYVEQGGYVYKKIIDLIKTYNKDKGDFRKSISIAVKKEMSSDLKKIFGFFQYSGLASYKGNLSKGEKGVFDLYLINLSALIDNNAILASKSINVVNLATALKSRNAHSFTRTNSEVLLPSTGATLNLSMPPCQSCGAERSSQEARFCSSCGAPLKAASIYAQLVDRDISVLPLTKIRVKAIREHSSIRKVKDVIHDIGYTELKSVPQVGDYWSSKIHRLAEEYIS